jgi:hypothetical protein
MANVSRAVDSARKAFSMRGGMLRTRPALRFFTLKRNVCAEKWTPLGLIRDRAKRSLTEPATALG